MATENSKLSRRLFLRNMAAGVAGTTLLGSCQPFAKTASRQSSDSRPNILFIMSDDHAYQAIKSYETHLAAFSITPNIDRLGQEGVRFNHAYCTNSICGPSRATVLTGKYSHKNRYAYNYYSKEVQARYNAKPPRTPGFDKFDPDQITFPKLLRKAGFQTALVGKWHINSDPTGFDYWNILPGQGRYFDPEFVLDGKKHVRKGYVTDLITADALRWLQARKRNTPFCMMVQFKSPHSPCYPPKRNKDLFKNIEIPMPDTFDDDYKGRPNAKRSHSTFLYQYEKAKHDFTNPQKLTGEALRRYKYQFYLNNYLGCIKTIDENIGRILKYLDETGLAENTLVVYTTDNGFFLGEHGFLDKRFMYEESQRVPLIIRYPKDISAGWVCDDFVINTDFAPTFLEYAGVDVPGDMQGRSVKPILAGRTPADWRKSVYYHFYENFDGIGEHYGVRTKDYKLIRFLEYIEDWELYDLRSDPQELNNVYNDPAYADVVKMMKKKLKRLREHYQDTL